MNKEELTQEADDISDILKEIHNKYPKYRTLILTLIEDTESDKISIKQLITSTQYEEGLLDVLTHVNDLIASSNVAVNNDNGNTH